MTDGPSTLSVYARLFRYARRYAGHLSLGIVAGLLVGGSLFGLLRVSPNILIPFERTVAAAPAAESEDVAPAGGEREPDAITQRVAELAERFNVPLTRDGGRITWQCMVLTLLALPVFVLIRALSAYANHYCMRWVGARVVRDLRDELFGHLQRQSLKFFGKSDIGQLISRCTNDTTIVEQTVAGTATELVRAPIEILAAAVFVVGAAVEHGFLGLILVMALLFPLVLLPMVVLGKFVRRYSRRALARISELVSRMHENFTGITAVKAYHMEQREQERFRDMNASYFRTVIRALRAELLMSPLVEAFGILLAGVFLVVCYARGIGLHQIIPVGLAGVVAYRPIKQLARLNAKLQRGGAALDRIFGLLDVDDPLAEAARPVPLDGFRDRIVFEGVHFAYDADAPRVLHDIDLDIPVGSVVALVGETGSGKTTMANLLARFYDPSSGRILLDGHDLREIEIASLRKLIGVVTQHTILFNDTIAHNIAYGTADATREAVEQAARRANAHAFIVADPAGYERVVGEKGFVLSGGERQRIAIARAILRDPPILILDEATSALDTVTERLVQEAISHVMQGRTVFAIAHRLSTIKHADQILLLDRGRVVERGTHEELYQRGGRYRRLCDMQVLEA